MSAGHAPAHGSKSHLRRCLLTCCVASPAGLLSHDFSFSVSFLSTGRS